MSSKRIKKSISISPSLHRDLRLLAENGGTSISEVMKTLVRRGMTLSRDSQEVLEVSMHRTALVRHFGTEKMAVFVIPRSLGWSSGHLTTHWTDHYRDIYVRVVDDEAQIAIHCQTDGYSVVKLPMFATQAMSTKAGDASSYAHNCFVAAIYIKCPECMLFVEDTKGSTLWITDCNLDHSLEGTAVCQNCDSAVEYSLGMVR